MRGRKSNFKGQQQSQDDRNKLRLGEFHRNASKKKTVRKPTLKKKLRDIQRLLEREGLPEEIKAKK